MVTRDLRKEFNRLYRASPGRVDVVDVPPMNFLMIDGPTSDDAFQDFRDSVEAIYTVSYALKILLGKSVISFEYAIMPLEALRWNDEDAASLPDGTPRRRWTLMIVQPGYVGEDLLSEVLKKVERKVNPRKLYQIRYEQFCEGLSAQTLHVGPYTEEGESVSRLHRTIRERGFQMRGRHHEIYLSDPGEVTPNLQRTIIRQPIE